MQFSPSTSGRHFKCTVIGSGNWGSAVAKMIGTNMQRLAAQSKDAHDDEPTFSASVNMWVYEEKVHDGQNLSEVINATHENVKYLPGILLPENVVAEPSLDKAVDGANLIVFVLPHQFLAKVLPTVKQHMAEDPIVCSLIKGIDFDDNGFVLISDRIRDVLGVDVSVLMGANVAREIAQEEFAEATIGGNPAHHGILREIFQTHYFRIACVSNVAAVEICGAVKNVVALGAGFCDGMNMGNNTKAAIIRIGMIEMGRLIERHTGRFPLEILVESCGAADLITTCYGGRNRKCAEHFIRSGKPWDVVEDELLNGQKLQGTLTCEEVYRVLSREGTTDDYPLIRNIYQIAFKGADPSLLVDGLVKEEQMQEKIPSRL